MRGPVRSRHPWRFRHSRLTASTPPRGRACRGDGTVLRAEKTHAMQRGLVIATQGQSIGSLFRLHGHRCYCTVCQFMSVYGLASRASAREKGWRFCPLHPASLAAKETAIPPSPRPTLHRHRRHHLLACARASAVAAVAAAPWHTSREVRTIHCPHGRALPVREDPDSLIPSGRCIQPRFAGTSSWSLLAAAPAWGCVASRKRVGHGIGWARSSLT